MLRSPAEPAATRDRNVCWDPPVCVTKATDPVGAQSQWYVGCVVTTMVTILHAFRLLGALWDGEGDGDEDSNPRRRRRRIAREIIIFLVAMAGVATFAAELRGCRGESGVVWLLLALAAANILIPSLLSDEDDRLLQ